MSPQTTKLGFGFYLLVNKKIPTIIKITGIKITGKLSRSVPTFLRKAIDIK
jgi:hypothetical protein